MQSMLLGPFLVGVPVLTVMWIIFGVAHFSASAVDDMCTTLDSWLVNPLGRDLGSVMPCAEPEVSLHTTPQTHQTRVSLLLAASTTPARVLWVMVSRLQVHSRWEVAILRSSPLVMLVNAAGDRSP